MNYHGEFLEDKWIDEHLRLPDKGFYVDCGCADPVIGNQCEFLRDKGWKGLNIDGNPCWQWPEGNLINVVLAIEPHADFYMDKEFPWISAIQPGGKTVETKRLDRILDEHKVIGVDFLNLDVEGSEFDVLQTFPLEDFKPLVIVSESMTMGKKDYRVMEYLLNTGDYCLIHRTPANMIFWRTDAALSL